mgnify:CR=1 FL=1
MHAVRKQYAYTCDRTLLQSFLCHGMAWNFYGMDTTTQHLLCCGLSSSRVPLSDCVQPTWCEAQHDCCSCIAC